MRSATSSAAAAEPLLTWASTASPRVEAARPGTLADRDRWHRAVGVGFDDGSDRRQGLHFHLAGDLLEQGSVLAEEIAHVFPALAEPHLTVGEPRAALLDHLGVESHVEHAARVGDALVVHDVELGDAERRRDLVLDNLDLDPVADDIEPLLEGIDLADVHAHRRVEL